MQVTYPSCIVVAIRTDGDLCDSKNLVTSALHSSLIIFVLQLFKNLYNKANQRTLPLFAVLELSTYPIFHPIKHI